nr:hypothetical protein [Streptomyces sp. MB09-01]
MFLPEDSNVFVQRFTPYMHRRVGTLRAFHQTRHLATRVEGGRVWQEARAFALSLDRAASPLARRPYDLRHTCITNWLNAGVPVAEVARRAGNSPEVIHQRYEGCIDGHEEPNNAKIAKAMGWAEP